MTLSPKVDQNTLAGFAAILLWSTTIAVVRSLSEQVGGLTTPVSVYLMGGVFCLFRLGWRGGIPKSFGRLPLRYLFGCGALFVFHNVVKATMAGLLELRDARAVARGRGVELHELFGAPPATA